MSPARLVIRGGERNSEYNGDFNLTKATTDASSYGIGSALFAKPVAFCSRTLTPAEVRVKSRKSAVRTSVWAFEWFSRYSPILTIADFDFTHQALERVPITCHRVLIAIEENTTQKQNK